MSCQHGNHIDACEICMEADATWDRAYAAGVAAERTRAEGEAVVGYLNISRFRHENGMVNHDFDYTGDLPDGNYPLYLHPPAEQSGVQLPADWKREGMVAVVDSTTGQLLGSMGRATWDAQQGKQPAVAVSDEVVSTGPATGLNAHGWRLAMGIMGTTDNDGNGPFEQPLASAIRAYVEAVAPLLRGVPDDLKALSDEVEACWICASIGEGEITLETINNWSGRLAELAASPTAPAGGE